MSGQELDKSGPMPSHSSSQLWLQTMPLGQDGSTHISSVLELEISHRQLVHQNYKLNDCSTWFHFHSSVNSCVACLSNLFPPFVVLVAGRWLLQLGWNQRLLPVFVLPCLHWFTPLELYLLLSTAKVPWSSQLKGSGIHLDASLGCKSSLCKLLCLKFQTSCLS